MNATAHVSFTIDEFATVIASNVEALAGIKAIIKRRQSGDISAPKAESATQTFNALNGANYKLLKSLREARLTSEGESTEVQLESDELAVSIAASTKSQAVCLALIEYHARHADLRKVEHGKFIFECLDSAIVKMQTAFSAMPKINNN